MARRKNGAAVDLPAEPAPVQAEPAVEQADDATVAAAIMDVVENYAEFISPNDAVIAPMAVRTIAGDLASWMLDRLRDEQDLRPWSQRSEGHQRMTIASVQSACEIAVRRAVDLIAADGRKTIAATLDQVTVKDGIKAVLTVARHDDERFALIDATGSRVVIVVADAERFLAERAPIKPTPDQPGLPGIVGVAETPATAPDPVEGADVVDVPPPSVAVDPVVDVAVH